MSATPVQYAGTELDALAEAKNYYQWILSHFAPYLGKKVIEVGAGVGTFSDFLLRDARVNELTLVGPTDNLFPLLKQRLTGDARVNVIQGYLENLNTSLSADSIVLVNVLEHIPDAEGVLRAAHRILVTGGTLLLFVPALPSLYGELDRAFEHVRRYTKLSLSCELKKAGFRLVRLRYFNFPGVFSWFLAGKVLRRNTLRPADVELYDRWVVPWAFRLEKFWEPPIGKASSRSPGTEGRGRPYG